MRSVIIAPCHCVSHDPHPIVMVAFIGLLALVSFVVVEETIVWWKGRK